MKTKKIAAVLLTCIVAIGLMAGCGASNTNQSASNNDSQSTSTNQSGNEDWLYIIQLQEIQKMLLKR